MTSGTGQKHLFTQLGRCTPRWRGAIVTFLVIAGGLAVSVPPALAQSDPVGEYDLKAAILYNLVKFVEWPPSAYSDSQAPTMLCVLGQDPFSDALELPGKAQNANGRPISIRLLKNENGIRGCQVLYIGTSERKSVAQILARLKESNVLTVGEMSQFAVQGGVIQFTLEDKQVRFEINLDAASRMSLKISSRLLMLARIVKDQKRNPVDTRGAVPAGHAAASRAFLSPLADPEHWANREPLKITLARRTPNSPDGKSTRMTESSVLSLTRVSPRSLFQNRNPRELRNSLPSPNYFPVSL